jgi:hypothetical protein
MANKARFGRAKSGWRIWEHPQPDCYYYIGADSARGTEHGDFAADCVWNGTTGEQAATLAERMPPDLHAEVLNAAGWYYATKNVPASLNIELTGNLGLETMRRLRDDYHYPNILGWRGRDDKPAKRRRHQTATLGWETQWRSRERMFIAFRTAVRAGECTIHDRVLYVQMEAAQRTQQMYRSGFEVSEGHDDVLIAALLAWIGITDFPPPKIGIRRKMAVEESDEPKDKKIFPVDETNFGHVHLMTMHQRRFEAKCKLDRMMGRSQAGTGMWR